MTAKKATLVKWDLPVPPDPYEDQPYHISLLGNPDDYHVLILASMGMTYDVISRQTGLSKAQISLRLKRANTNRKEHERISAKNYRNGLSAASRACVQLASEKVAKLINPGVRKSLAYYDV